MTERRGLKADLIRLQREEVAVLIAQKARERLIQSDTSVRPIPIKGMVNFLEYASLEDAEDDVMVSMWAGLLANAASMGDSSLSRFVRVLSEMNAGQAKLLERIVWQGEPNKTVDADEHLQQVIDSPTASWLIEAIRDATAETPKEIFGRMEKILARPGVAVRHASIYQNGSGSFKGSIQGGLHVLPEEALDYAVLENLGLIKGEEINVSAGMMLMSGDFPFSVSAAWYRVTDMGGYLYGRCTRV